MATTSLEALPLTESLTADNLDFALKNDELVVYYQPKVGLNNSAICAVEALVRWQHPDKGLIPPDSFIPLAEKLDELIGKYNIPASQIILEVTESELSQELIKFLDILTRLRLKGFKLSIDDFGTGYSSLVQLYRAPFSEIKVDRSFISEMESDPEAATIVETIIMMGQKLNMHTVAEGVETESCKKRLSELNCDQAQGYLFSKPMPAEAVFKWFQTQK